jgi:hypothetical protein
MKDIKGRQATSKPRGLTLVFTTRPDTTVRELSRPDTFLSIHHPNLFFLWMFCAALPVAGAYGLKRSVF